jgi:hypothetical protein
MPCDRVTARALPVSLQLQPIRGRFHTAMHGTRSTDHRAGPPAFASDGDATAAGRRGPPASSFLSSWTIEFPDPTKGLLLLFACFLERAQVPKPQMGLCNAFCRFARNLLASRFRTHCTVPLFLSHAAMRTPRLSHKSTV